ncbi:MAG: hypothetical protein ABEI74_03360 [Candidatus Pacearchaeota archaeon]
MAERKSIDKETLKEEAKYVLKFYTTAIKNIFPMTEAKKNEYKEYLNEMKDYYQQKIEDRTSVSLGEIEVKLPSEFSEDAVYEFLINHLSKNERKIKSGNGEECCTRF